MSQRLKVRSKEAELKPESKEKEVSLIGGKGAMGWRRV